MGNFAEVSFSGDPATNQVVDPDRPKFPHCHKPPTKGGSLRVISNERCRNGSLANGMAFLAAGCSAFSVSARASSVVAVYHLRHSLRSVDMGNNWDAERAKVAHQRVAASGAFRSKSLPFLTLPILGWGRVGHDSLGTP